MSPRRAAPEWTERRSGKILVVGGGPAAIAAVEELRALGFAGSITGLCGDPSGAYDRTACSKGIIDGTQHPADAALTLPGGAHWKLGETAIEVDPRGHLVVGSSGERYDYDGLVIATGTTAVIPEGFSLDETGIYQLRSVHDAWAIRKALRRARTVAIVGGGLTGCELACSVTQAATSAIVVDPHLVLLEDILGERFGAMVTNDHRESGIIPILGRSVVDLGRRRGQFCLRLDASDETIEAEAVVLATGQRPDTAWLAGVGFDLSDGVLCDEGLRVVGSDGAVVAAGSIARWPNEYYGGELMRCEQWITAMEQGTAAARTLMSPTDDIEPCRVIPRYASHQRRLRLQVAGRVDLADEVRVTRVKPGKHSPVRSGVIATYHHGQHLVGVAAVNAPQSLLNGVPPVDRPVEQPGAGSVRGSEK